VNGAENGRLMRTIGRLMDGQQEALEVVRRALDDEGASAEEALEDLEDILEGALEDARAILGIEEDEGDGA
jgi:signal transduction histidine kinase